MPTNIEMPKLSDTMTEGTLVKWNKQVGDTIEIGDVIAEVETDKATMEMEAFDEGTLHEILVQEGQKAAVGSTLGVLIEDGEEAPASGSTPAAVVLRTSNLLLRRLRKVSPNQCQLPRRLRPRFLSHQ